MALIDPNFYTGPALIVGDGNFSFAACLARSLGETSTPIFATSLDNEEQLKTNSLAIENLEKISVIPTFKAIHGVDATDLDATFKDQVFHRIIFNFPHTGGKVKISKCRELLEKFFISAARHVEPNRGVVCVSLCQGQGGTPRDAVQREYGNTWQVVEQACKAGFILNAVHSFKESDYPGYSSAGFKGRLHQSFLTERGLTYMFIPSHPIPSVSDLNSFLQSKEVLTNHKKLFLIQGHPIEIVRKKLENCVTNLPKIKEGTERFNIISGEQDSYVDLADRFSDSCSMTSDQCWGYTCNNVSSLYQRVQKSIVQGQKSFVVMDPETDHSVPISAGFHPISHTMVIVRIYEGNTPLRDVESDLEHTYRTIIQDVCPGILLIPGELPKQHIYIDLDFKRSQMNIFKPSDYQALRERQRVENEWRPKRLEKHEECHCTECCSVKKRTGNLCELCTLEGKYLIKEKYLKAADLVDFSTAHKFYSSRGLVLTSGVITSSKMKMISGSNSEQGWAILVHLDHLAMELFEIKDMRMLWSQQGSFLHQFSTQDKNSSFPSHFIPFSLFPPVYIHDIAFWLTADSREDKFFKAIYNVTQNCVCDVWLRDRYVDKEKNRVSYGYRMLYSRCDGPLTHLQTVEMQNLLRRLLINLNFNLS